MSDIGLGGGIDLGRQTPNAGTNYWKKGMQLGPEKTLWLHIAEPRPLTSLANISLAY